MTPETKAWVEELKNNKIKTKDHANIYFLILIIESQEKEIEKLNFIITTVLDPSRKLSKIEGLEAK